MMDFIQNPNKSQSFTITTTGLDRVNKAIRDLGTLDKEKALKSGFYAFGNKLISGGRKRLLSRIKHPGKSTGGLYKSFRVKIKKSGTGALVGFDKRGHHSHLVDRGTKKRSTKAGKNRGIMPGNRFWTDTADNDVTKASESMYNAIERAVDRIIARA